MRVFVRISCYKPKFARSRSVVKRTKAPDDFWYGDSHLYTSIDAPRACDYCAREECRTKESARARKTRGRMERQEIETSVHFSHLVGYNTMLRGYYEHNQPRSARKGKKEGLTVMRIWT